MNLQGIGKLFPVSIKNHIGEYEAVMALYQGDPDGQKYNKTRVSQGCCSKRAGGE